MYHLRSLFFVLAFVLFDFDSVQGNEVCDFNDTDCLTRGARNVYKAAVTGVRDLIEPIDPLFLKQFGGVMITLNYNLTNVTLTGMRNCEVKLLKLNKEPSTYEYHLHCPQLVFDYYYEVTGKLFDNEVNGEGLCMVTTDDYLIRIKGNTETFTSQKDQKPRLIFKDFKVETDLRGKMTFENEKLTKGDKTKFDFIKAYINNNDKAMEAHLRSPILENFLAEFIKTMAIYMTAVPLDEVFPKNQK